MRTRLPCSSSLLAAIALVVVAGACGDNDPLTARPVTIDDTGTPSGPPAPPPFDGPVFTVSPLPMETIYQISPVGSNNEIFPVEQTYWETCDPEQAGRDAPDGGAAPGCHLEQQVLVAPGPGMVSWVDASEDGSLRVTGPGGYVWQFDHVTPLVTAGSALSAGRPIAKMYYRYGFDFVVWQTKDPVTTGIANPKRFPPYPAVHPIALYRDSLRVKLTALVSAGEGASLGSAHWDVPGTAMGAWFLEGAPEGDLLGPDGVPYTLFLGRYTLRQSVRLVAVGEPWPGMQNRSLALDPSARDWETITPGSGRIAQRAWNAPQTGEIDHDRPGGTFLVEMLAPDRLRIEWFDTHEPVTEFTDAARVYVR